MAEGVVALQAAEVIRWSTFRQAIGIAGGDVQGVEHPQPVLEIRNLSSQGLGHDGRQIAERSPKAVPPVLLTVAEVQGLQGLLHGLMTGEAGPLVVASVSAELGLGQVCLGLMEPVG